MALGMEREREMKSRNTQRWNWQNLVADWMSREKGREESKMALDSLALMTVRIPGLFTGIEGTKERTYLDYTI